MPSRPISAASQSSCQQTPATVQRPISKRSRLEIREIDGYVATGRARDAVDRWRAVEVGPDGWRVIGSPPVRFRRPPGMLPIPAPERGGSVEALGSFLNLPSR